MRRKKQSMPNDIMNLTRMGVLGGTGMMAIGSVVGETGGITNVMKFMPMVGTAMGAKLLLSSTNGLAQSAGLRQRKRRGRYGI